MRGDETVGCACSPVGLARAGVETRGDHRSRPDRLSVRSTQWLVFLVSGPTADETTRPPSSKTTPNSFVVAPSAQRQVHSSWRFSA